MLLEDEGTLPEWLNNLGYSAEGEALHQSVAEIPTRHPYARELGALLAPEGSIRAQAVFAADGTPSVVFLNRAGQPYSRAEVDEIRQRIWNQNLASIVVEIKGDSAAAFPAGKVEDDAPITLQFNEARPDGVLSARDIQSANLAERKPEWFRRKDRVDHRLITNITELVSKLAELESDDELAKTKKRVDAQILVGQILFISYLEHREIVGPIYREKRNVGSLHDLIARADRPGVAKLIDALKEDFNGDFLSDERHQYWDHLTADEFLLLNEFLKQTQMSTGQGHFWNYDFSFIPVELLSSLYEAFLNADQKKKEGAVYTPRHLAVLTVDQALSQVDDLCAARIFDGACGSGILLTTALRRLILAHEAKLGRAATLRERIDILVNQIFGSDINAMAGQVTAFSLYLSILEDLDPKDILDAQARHESKLPHLKNRNLVCRPAGNFFSPQHPFLNQSFDVIISNPPWLEAEGGTRTLADRWSERDSEPVVRRQISAAFALRSKQFVKEDGIICLILPIPLFLGTTSQFFVERFFSYTRPVHLINFGDLQQLLFLTAINTCHVYVGRKRAAKYQPDLTETFDYSVPKAELSLTMGRLSLQSSDRHRLSTAQVVTNNEILTNYMWGDGNDVALMAKLTSYGSVQDMTLPRRGSNQGWIIRKGVHLKDASRKPVSAAPLFNYPFFYPDLLNVKCPVWSALAPDAWPRTASEVVGLDDALLGTFDGPRVLFADGFDKGERTPRAVFVKEKGAFTSSVGVISGPDDDEDLLRFLAVYLRSTMCQYLMMMSSAKMLTERNGIHLADVKRFPFFRPEDAPAPSAAREALAKVAMLTRELDASGEDGEQLYNGMAAELDELIFQYFGMSDAEAGRVRETVEILLPTIRPRSQTMLREIARNRVTEAGMRKYASQLLSALTEWRDALGGHGHFHVSAQTSEVAKAGASAVAQVEFRSEQDAVDLVKSGVDELFVNTVIARLHHDGLTQHRQSGGMSYTPSVEIWLDNKFYVARPLTRRNWTSVMAKRDADRLVQAVRKTSQRMRPTQAASDSK